MKKNSPVKRSFDSFVSHIELVAMGLNEGSSRLERRAYMRSQRDKRTTEKKVAADFRLEDMGPGFFDGLAHYELTVVEHERKTKALSIEAVFEVHFHAPVPIDKENARRFVDKFLAAITWPYFRQFVFDTTSRMGIPPTTLPLISEK